MQNKKGQSTSLGAILITGIILSLVLITYVWGQGLVETQQTVTTANYMETRMLDFRTSINEVAHEGINSTRLVHFSISEGTLEIQNGSYCSGGSPNNNALVYELGTSSELVESRNLISIDPIESNMDCTASYSNSSSSVLLAKSDKAGNDYLNIYKLWFRQLNDSSGNGYLIKLLPGDVSGVSGGSYTAVFRNNRTYNDAGVITTEVIVDFI